MEQRDWPIDAKDWKSKYTKYHDDYKREYLLHINPNSNPQTRSDTERHLPLLRTFATNNIALNNLLLNLKKNPTEKKIKRLGERVDEYKSEIDKIEKEINNTDDNIETLKLEEKINFIISPQLLEASEQFLRENEAIQTFDKHNFGSKMLSSIYRPGGPIYQKQMESFNTAWSKLQSGKGKYIKKKTKKKRGGEKTSKQTNDANKARNTYVLENIISKTKKNPKKYAKKLRTRVEKINKEDINIDPLVLKNAEKILEDKAMKTFNNYNFGSKIRENLWRPPTMQDDGGYDTGGPFYKKVEKSFSKLQNESTKTQHGKGKKRSKSKRKSKKKTKSRK